MSWRIVRRVQSSVLLAGGHTTSISNPPDSDDLRIAQIEWQLLRLRVKFQRGANLCLNRHATRPCPATIHHCRASARTLTRDIAMKSGTHKAVNRRLAGAALCLAVTIMSPVAAQEYTLQDFVNDADAIVVAEIISKKAEWMTVHTPQPDGSISIAKDVFTRYEIEVMDFIGAEKHSNIHEFVLPGGEADKKIHYWSHVPELSEGIMILVSLDYDDLNHVYMINGIPPVGPVGGTFIVSETSGKRVLIPYLSYASPDHPLWNDRKPLISDRINATTALSDAIDSDAIDYESMWTAVSEASHGKK